MAKSSTTTLSSPKRKPSKKSTVVVTVFLVTALLFALALLLFQQRSRPEAVFNAMIENSLRTSSVTRSITQESPGQELDQTIQLLSGEQHVAHGNTVLTQTGLQEAVVETQSIGTPRTDYVRYIDIETTQKNQAGNDYDFSDVLGIWGKSPTSVETTGQLYNESILGVVPIANLPAESRNNLMRIVRDSGVYEVDYSSVRSGNLNGRPTYTYDVTVKPTAYIAFLKQFGNEVGLTQLADLDPSTYENATPLQFVITVDVLTRRLQQISFENGRQETFGSYGLHQSVDLPEQTIPIMELQNRIQTVQ